MLLHRAGYRSPVPPAPAYHERWIAQHLKFSPLAISRAARRCHADRASTFRSARSRRWRVTCEQWGCRTRSRFYRAHPAVLSGRHVIGIVFFGAPLIMTLGTTCRHGCSSVYQRTFSPPFGVPAGLAWARQVSPTASERLRPSCRSHPVMFHALADGLGRLSIGGDNVRRGICRVLSVRSSSPLFRFGAFWLHGGRSPLCRAFKAPSLSLLTALLRRRARSWRHSYRGRGGTRHDRRRAHPDVLTTLLTPAMPKARAGYCRPPHLGGHSRLYPHHEAQSYRGSGPALPHGTTCHRISVMVVLKRPSPLGRDFAWPPLPVLPAPW